MESWYQTEGRTMN